MIGSFPFVTQQLLKSSLASATTIRLIFVNFLSAVCSRVIRNKMKNLDLCLLQTRSSNLRSLERIMEHKIELIVYYLQKYFDVPGRGQLGVDKFPESGVCGGMILGGPHKCMTPHRPR